MMFWENLRMAFISLKNAKLRSFLTMLGMIIGVAAVVSITAIGQGVKDAVTKQVTGLGSNVLSVTSGGGSNQSGGKSAPSFTAALGSSTLTQADAVSVGKVQNTENTTSISLISGVLAEGTTTASGALIVATTANYARVVDQKLAAGQFIGDDQLNQNVIVLGDTVKTELFGTGDAMGRTVTFRGKPFTVIGVIVKQDSGLSLGTSQDSFAYIPTGTAKVLIGQEPSILRIITKVNSPSNVDGAVAGIKAALKQNHAGQEDFSVLTQADILSTFNTILDLLTTFIAAIAAISLLVGGIGIMNIMLVSVTERTREIGLRKAIGASSGTVLSQFLIEAVVISLVGGALGIVVAVLLATGIGRAAGITPSFTLPTIILAVGVSAGVGILFGIAPAAKASRLRPIQALKSV